MGNTINRTPSFSPTARTTGPTQANPAASAKATRELGDLNAQLKTLAQPQAATKQTATTDRKSTGDTLNGLKDAYLGNLDLSETANARALSKAQEKVDAFVAANPNATQEQVEAEAKKALGSTSTSEYIFKSIISKSMNDIMAKVQERIDESK
ncbi:hypothetical protein [Corallococcus exercitus]|uniref:hypothetical protein n=1 Tax=Corallococcus exercitus TaxID=2316736 RepID=UPI0035D4070D